jgi:ATP-binding cassette subfamily B protein
MTTARYSTLTLCRRLLRRARPYWPHIGGLFLIGLLSSPLALLTPLPLKLAVDSVLGAQPFPGFLEALLPAAATRSYALALAAGLMVAIGLLVHVQALASWLLQTYTGEKLVLEFRSQLFRHVQRVSLSYHDTQGTTDSLYRIQYDAPSQWFLIKGAIPLITSGVTVTGMIYVTARIDWQLALVALTVSPILFLLTKALSHRLRGRWHEVKELESSAMSVVQEVLTALRIVKAFGQEDHEHRRFMQHASQTIGGQIRLAFIEGGFDLIVGLTIATGTATALFIGVRHVQSGVLTLGELLIVMSYLAQLYRPLESIAKQVTGLQSSLASAERALALLDEGPDVTERANARRISRASGALIFQSVSFAYDKDHPVLQEISFEIGPRGRVGIMGTTGAGKTTLISLLMRFYDPIAGQILLDGHDLREYKLADLRNQFAIVLQEPVLFSTSIAENIAYACPDASEEEIIEAAKAANAHEFIVHLPDGYETLVGERGMRLSGGERQRIALARAFLKQAPMLILDEPTSSVDIKTEAAIIEAMERLMQDRTSFLITHRPSALKPCNIILKIESGRLVDVIRAVPPAVGEASISDGRDAAICWGKAKA